MRPRAVMVLCSTLELAGNARTDVRDIRVKPVLGVTTHVWVEIHSGGTAERKIEANIERICDGRSCRKVLDDWIGPEEHPAKNPVLDAQPITMADLFERNPSK